MTMLFNWLIPITCIICGFKSTGKICADCLSWLPWLKNACSICANPLPLSHPLTPCGECLIDPPPIDKSLVLFHYQFPLTSLITQLKFQKKLLFASPLGALLANAIQTHYLESKSPLPGCIIPVPLFRTRLARRGFNQALEIARPIKKRLKIPIKYLSLKRIRPTLPQTLLPADHRLSNVKGAFQVVKKIEFHHVAIVDDVITTFSTLAEIANVLRKNGVQRIDAWCLAKAVN